MGGPIGPPRGENLSHSLLQIFFLSTNQIPAKPRLLWYQNFASRPIKLQQNLSHFSLSGTCQKCLINARGLADHADFLMTAAYFLMSDA